jgi:hypothetical protein
MKRSTLLIYGAATLLLGLASTPAMSFDLDLFTDGNATNSFGNPEQQLPISVIKNTSQSVTDTDIGLTGVAWGQRRLDLSATAAVAKNGTGDITVTDGTADISAKSSLTVTSAKFTWGFDSNTVYQDITDGGMDNALSLDVISSDQGGTDLALKVTDSNGDFGTASALDITAGGVENFLYSDILTSNSAVDLNAIKKIEMNITGAPADFDASFDFIKSAAVPFEFSPSLGLIMCGSFFGFHVCKKRLKSN